MGESEKPGAPSELPGAHPGADATTCKATLEQARQFLSDDTVRNSSSESKAAFLKGKGFGDDEIKQLLSEDSQPADAAEEGQAEAAQEADVSQETTAPSSTAAARLPAAPAAEGPSPPPIITYPEFLTHSPRPPPLLTPTRLLNLLAVSGSAWTLLYGAARFIVNPMVDTLDESRSDYYTHVNSKLSQLVDKLEDTASEVPYKNGKPLRSLETEDDASRYDDPTELFHRDIGTQTSPRAFNSPLGAIAAETPADMHARRLAQLSAGLKDLTSLYTKTSEEKENLHGTVREIREHVDKLAYPSLADYSTLYGGSGFGMARAEPDDEYKRTKDAIRSVKGVFLSAKMFPTAAR